MLTSKSMIQHVCGMLSSIHTRHVGKADVLTGAILCRSLMEPVADATIRVLRLTDGITDMLVIQLMLEEVRSNSCVLSTQNTRRPHACDAIPTTHTTSPVRMLVTF